MKGKRSSQSVMVTCFVLITIGSSPINLGAQLIHIDSYDQGLQLTRSGKLSEAGDFWMSQGDERSKQSTEPERLKESALAYVLASKVFEMANNAKAYQSWGKAIQRLMEAKTNWEDERGKIQQATQNLLTGVQASLSQETGGISLSKEEQTWLALDQELDILSFHGPQLGLAETSDSSPQPLLPSSGRNYHGRPLFIVEEEQNVSSTLSAPQNIPDTSTSRIPRSVQPK